jgi:hypothetical protein
MKIIDKTPPTTNPWYKEPWPWLLMLGPALVVLAGVHMLIVSLNMNHDLVVDDYYKEGQGIHLNQDKQKAALAAKVQSDIFVSADAQKIRLILTGDLALPPDLQLSFFHPLEKKYDITLTLHPTDMPPLVNGQTPVYTYELAVPPLPKAKHWYVRLENIPATWQLDGSWFPEKTDIPLQLRTQ